MTVDMGVQVGDLELLNPIMTAAGTAGHGAELAAYMNLGGLGAVVTKSLSAEPWSGNPAPRVNAAAAGGMVNSVGLQNPGVRAWAASGLPALRAAGATVVAGLWGHTEGEYQLAAEAVSSFASELAAVEVNLSCPNLGEGPSGRHDMFSATAGSAAAGIRAASGCGTRRWAKLSPAVADLPSVAEACLEAGAEAITLINTMPAMVIDIEARRPVLGAGGGGLSGPPIHPIAVRAVWECRRALGDVPIVAAGGVTTGADAVELMMAGASAVQVGTATFREPAAAARVLREMEEWSERHGVARIAELTGAAHG